MKSPLILPVTLTIAAVLAFMATTGILPPTMFRLWPVLFVILGVVGLLSLSSEELEQPTKKATKKAAPKKTKASSKKRVTKSSVSKKSSSKKSTSSKKKSTTRKAAKKTTKKSTSKSKKK